MGSQSSEVHTYAVVLTPRGVSLANASDTRRFEAQLPVTITDREALTEAVEEHILAEEPIDAWAFRKHWDISHIIRTDGREADRLRDTLLGFTVTATAETRGLATQALYLLDIDGTWGQATVAVEPSTAESFRKWVADICDSDEFDTMHNREVHDAVVQVVAAENPAISDQLLDDPLDKPTGVLKHAMDSEEAVLQVLHATR